MWIEVSCWMDLRRSLSPLVLCVLVFCPPFGLLPRFAFQLYMYTRLLPAVSRSLANSFWLVICSLVIHTLIHYILNMAQVRVCNWVTTIGEACQADGGSIGYTTKFILEETEKLEIPGTPAEPLRGQTRISMGRATSNISNERRERERKQAG